MTTVQSAIPHQINDGLTRLFKFSTSSKFTPISFFTSSSAPSAAPICGRRGDQRTKGIND